MLPELSRGFRLALMLSLSVCYVAYHGATHAAFAKGPDDGGGGDDEDDGGGDDKPPSGEGGDDDDDDGPDKDQPPVTAGGLFTINTYPVREIGRPLTMTQRITQLKVSAGTDLSAKGAFGSGGLSVEAVHGVKDNFSIIGGLVDAYNFKQFSVYFGFEGALAYDFLDIRLAANLHRFAVARFCSQDSGEAQCVGVDPTLPSGNFNASGTQVSVDLGFPFRYPFTPEVAVVALQTLISIDFNAAERGTQAGRDAAVMAGRPLICSAITPASGDGTMSAMNADPANCVENGAKPDFNPSVGIAANPVPPLSVVIFGQLRIPDFDTSVGNFQIPVTARVEFSPSQKFDIGLEFTLLNVKPPDPQSPIDNRFLSAFVQARF
jgi:hypothetical protein